MQSDESINCGFYCIAFIEYIIKGKTLLDYTNLFSPNGYQNNGKIIYKYFKYKYGKENVSLEFILKNLDETRNCLLDEIKHNDLLNEKHKKVGSALNYFEHCLVFVSAISSCVSIYAFLSLVGAPVSIASSAVGLKNYAITAGIKKFELIINKKRKKHTKILLLAKTELNTIEVLVFNTLIDSNLIDLLL